MTEDENAEVLGLVATFQRLCEAERRDYRMPVLFKDELSSVKQRLVVRN